MTDMKLNAISTAPRQNRGWARDAFWIVSVSIGLWLAIAYAVFWL